MITFFLVSYKSDVSRYISGFHKLISVWFNTNTIPSAISKGWVFLNWSILSPARVQTQSSLGEGKQGVCERRGAYRVSQHPWAGSWEDKREHPWDSVTSGVRALGCSRDSPSNGIIGHTSFCWAKPWRLCLQASLMQGWKKYIRKKKESEVNTHTHKKEATWRLAMPQEAGGCPSHPAEGR